MFTMSEAEEIIKKFEESGIGVVPTYVGGELIINTTPHEINFGVGRKYCVEVVPPSVLINATVEETVVAERGGVEFVKSTYSGNSEGEEIIEKIYNIEKEVIIIGSIIAAQAYPGKVFGMCPCPGYERVAPAEKRMSCEKFITF